MRIGACPWHRRDSPASHHLVRRQLLRRLYPIRRKGWIHCVDADIVLINSMAKVLKTSSRPPLSHCKLAHTKAVEWHRWTRQQDDFASLRVSTARGRAPTRPPPSHADPNKRHFRRSLHHCFIDPVPALLIRISTSECASGGVDDLARPRALPRRWPPQRTSPDYREPRRLLLQPSSWRATRTRFTFGGQPQKLQDQCRCCTGNNGNFSFQIKIHSREGCRRRL